MLNQKKLTLLLTVFLLSCLSYVRANTQVGSGSQLFRDNCAACHKIGVDLIGPDLTDITSKRPHNWIVRFIQHSQDVIQSGDPYANDLFKQYKQVIMPETELTETEIDTILSYISKTAASEKISGQIITFTAKKAISSETLYHRRLLQWSIVLFILIILLSPFVFLSLKQKFYPKKIGEYGAFARFILLFREFLFTRVSAIFYIVNGVIIIILITAFQYDTITGKKHELQKQTVVFSHTVHTDSISTDCIFCHGGARTQDIAGLPAVSTCMKCHDYIVKGKIAGNSELNQLISLSKQNKNIQWATGFRYNDYVHFSHSDHYVTGKLQCRQCHDDPENVEVKKTVFTMRWCIDCHKLLTINKLNKYYRRLTDSTMMANPVKVSEAGGIDCIQCHY